MRWKDAGEMTDKEDTSLEEENFDEEQFSPWSAQKGRHKHTSLFKTPVLLILLVAAIVASIGALFMLLMEGKGGKADSQQLASFEERLKKLEDRLDKFEAIDEKVTRIWEQAKSFEKFKDRFDRSEASTSLRMDHLTMSLETLQKQLTKPKASGSSSPPQEKQVTEKKTDQVRYHQVQAGDTLYSISRKYRLKVDELLQMNQMKPGNLIRPGQKLVVHRSTE